MPVSIYAYFHNVFGNRRDAYPGYRGSSSISQYGVPDVETEEQIDTRSAHSKRRREMIIRKVEEKVACKDICKYLAYC